ncbi:MAG: hypothetical protein KDA44_11605 [Planctomycetales bacterium]|nr:hypothetical protein [Planctomycetales bacterium]
MDQGSAPQPLVTNSADEAPEYRALSPLSLVALALGLLSPVAWAAPFLLIVPAAAVAAALLALAGIARSEGRLAGGAVARLGMAVALICVATALVRGPVRARLIQRQLDEVAQQWVDELQSQQFDAVLNMLAPRAVHGFVPDRGPGAPSPSEEEVRALAVAGLQKDPLTTYLADLGPVRVERVGDVATPVFEGQTVRAGAGYALSPVAGKSSAAKGPTLHLVFLRADMFESAGAPWRIERWTLDDAP